MSREGDMRLSELQQMIADMGSIDPEARVWVRVAGEYADHPLLKVTGAQGLGDEDDELADGAREGDLVLRFEASGGSV